MPEPPLTSYDELPYSCHPLHLTHPNHLACRAMFYGLKSPDVAHCRVLELGCGNGNNLLSLAQSLPQSEFVGIDYAARQINHGREVIAAVGLRNVELKAMSLADVDGSLGEFDYILCHGVFSWVSAENQDHILRVIRQQLAPSGVGYVSYNTYPGWHLRGMVRDMLCYQVRDLQDPAEKVARARAYLHFLIQSQPEPESAYVQVLKAEERILERVPDTYIFHEHLEEVNQPQYFHQFAERAAKHELQYLDEARFHAELVNLSPEVLAKLNLLKLERIEYEQQIDFLLNGTFRRSLVCHREVALAAEASPAAMRQMYLSTRAKPAREQVSFDPNVAEEFKDQADATITTNHPLVKAALLSLSHVSPRSLSFGELYAAAVQRLGRATDPAGDEPEIELLAEALFRCHHCQLIDVQMHPPPIPREAAHTPRTTRLALWQAANNEPISNLNHCCVEVTEPERYLLSLLDGQRTRSDLHAILAEQVRQGVLVLEKQGQAIHAPEKTQSVIEQTIARSLQKFAALFLLCDG